jgi:hypothetical protein
LLATLRGKSLENNNYKSSYFILLLTCLADSNSQEQARKCVLNECRILKSKCAAAAVWIFHLRGDRKFLRLIAGEAASFKIERASLDFSTTCRFSSIRLLCFKEKRAVWETRVESVRSEPYAYKHPNAFNFPKAGR